MGLDLQVLARPRAGDEAEFDALLREISIADGRMADPAPKRRLFGLLPPAPPRLSPHERAAKLARFQDIGVEGYADLGAPRVGQDAAADARIRADFASGKLAHLGATEAEVLARLKGHYLLSMLPACDGLPVYCNADAGYGVDETSFRGAFLATCTDVLDKAEIERAWTLLTAPELAVWGRTLAESARQFARTHGLEPLIGQRDSNWTDETSAEAQVHIVDSLARWALFWSAKGHGSDPYF